eukprot:6173260-Pleurochrysis_carterae.AAC.2
MAALNSLQIALTAQDMLLSICLPVFPGRYPSRCSTPKLPGKARAYVCMQQNGYSSQTVCDRRLLKRRTNKSLQTASQTGSPPICDATSSGKTRAKLKSRNETICVHRGLKSIWVNLHQAKSDACTTFERSDKSRKHFNS